MGDQGDNGDNVRAGKFDGDDLTRKMIGTAIRVHNELGPGFEESIYHNALVIELANVGLNFESEFPITVRYCGKVVGKHRIDLLIEGAIVVELKVVEELTKRHYRQLRSYLKSAKINTGLLINFDDEKLDFRRVDASTKPHTSPPSP